MDAQQFALVKLLFGRVCDLPEHERMQQVLAATDDTVVVDEVLMLARSSALPTGRFAQPLLQAVAEVSAERLRSGVVLGAWTLGEEIGHGGMGRVFKARRSDGHFEQQAAIKLLAGLSSRAALDYLARERQILASLSHPNIARLLDGGSTPQGQPFLVMEYVDGVAIDRYCALHALSAGAVLRLFGDVCAAVAFAHQQLVVHCDLKPSNILVTPGARPVLLDFGVSRLLGEAGAENVETAAPVGAGVTGMAYTPRYASPEQKAGLRTGTASDVYSLGLVLAELLGARAADAELLQLEGLPRDLAAILQRATRPDAAGRYAGVDAFATDVNRYLRGEPVAARATTPLYIAQKWTVRHWPWLAAAALFIALIGAFSWRMRVQRDSAVAAEREARAVKDYLVTVFQGADPEVSGRRDLPVSELLDAGRDGLAADLREQPLLRAEMSGILGGVYQTIGKREQALRMFDEAIALERGNARPLVLAGLLHRRAYTSYDQEDFPQAEPIAREALQIHEQLAPESLLLVDSLRLLGTIVLYRDRREESHALLTRALAMAIRISGEDSVATGRVHLDFGRFHGYFDQVATGAIVHSRKAQQIFARQLGEEHNLYVDALEILVLGLGSTHAYAEALPLAREVSEKRSRRYGEISYQGGYALYTYANLLHEAGQRRQAVPLLERCLAIQEQLDGKATLSSTAPLYLLARVHESLGNLDQAWNLFEQVVEIRTRLLPEENRELVDVDAHFGTIRRLQGRIAEAQAITATVLRQRNENPYTHPYWRMQSQLELATTLRLAGQLGQAETLLASIDPAAMRDSTRSQGAVEAEHARILIARGDRATALALLLQAEARFAQELGAQHPDLWLLRIDRAALLDSTGQATAAKALAAEIVEKAAPAMTPEGAKRLAALGRRD